MNRLRHLRELVERRDTAEACIAAQRRLIAMLDKKIRLAVLAHEGDDLDERISDLKARLIALTETR